MKVVIAGSRHFKGYDLLKEKCDSILKNTSDVEVVCGMCPNGADKLAVQYAKERGYPIKEFPAEWSKHGRAAGPIRNKQMAEYADALIAFNSGGGGTVNMIKEASRCNLKIREIPVTTVFQHGKEEYIQRKGL